MHGQNKITSPSGYLMSGKGAYAWCPLSTVLGWYEGINDAYCYFCHNHNSSNP